MCFKALKIKLFSLLIIPRGDVHVLHDGDVRVLGGDAHVLRDDDVHVLRDDDVHVLHGGLLLSTFIQFLILPRFLSRSNRCFLLN